MPRPLSNSKRVTFHVPDLLYSSLSESGAVLVQVVLREGSGVMICWNVQAAVHAEGRIFYAAYQETHDQSARSLFLHAQVTYREQTR